MTSVNSLVFVFDQLKRLPYGKTEREREARRSNADRDAVFSENPMSGAPGEKDDVEITPEMIRAGNARLDYLLDGSIENETGLMCIPGDWASEVYRAMERVRRHHRNLG